MSVVAGLVCGVALFFGASLFSFIPKVVLGSMLVYLGLSFLVEWLIDSRRVLPLLDYLLIWVDPGHHPVGRVSCRPSPSACWWPPSCS